MQIRATGDRFPMHMIQEAAPGLDSHRQLLFTPKWLRHGMIMIHYRTIVATSQKY